MKKYWQFIKESRDTEIHDICREYDIENYTINEDDSIDVDDNVSLGGRGLERMPIKFREVTGNFNCSYNRLNSLEGCPEKVGGNFHCGNNNLTSLKGGPERVGRYFYCSLNNLTSLEGCPERVGGHFYCECNNLTSLKGGPERVGGDFYCSLNNLTSLEDFPLYFDTDKTVDIKDNPIHEIYTLFDEPGAIELMNDYGLIDTDSMEVSYTILEEIFGTLGKKPPSFEHIRLRHYTLID